MLRPVHAATAYSPQLAVGLRKIARTPAARLALGYRLGSRRARFAARPAGDAPARAPVESAARRACVPRGAGPIKHFPPLPIGPEMLVQRIVAGGLIGELLPIEVLGGSPDRRDLLGSLLDVTV